LGLRDGVLSKSSGKSEREKRESARNVVGRNRISKGANHDVAAFPSEKEMENAGSVRGERDRDLDKWWIS